MGQVVQIQCSSLRTWCLGSCCPLAASQLCHAPALDRADSPVLQVRVNVDAFLVIAPHAVQVGVAYVRQQLRQVKAEPLEPLPFQLRVIEVE